MIALDCGLTSSEESQRAVEHDARLVHADVCNPDEYAPLLDGVDAVMHLASVVGDPACNRARDLAWQINYLGTVALADACRKARVSRFVFASTCSFKGWQTRETLGEEAPLNPQSIYAMTKILSEHYLLSVRDIGFDPYILRFSTVYGLSPRMRFARAVNQMTARAVSEWIVEVHGG